jgi:hypothetical protein
MDFGGLKLDTQYTSEREKVLEHEVECLRDQLSNQKYISDSKLEEEIEELKNKNKALELALQGRIEREIKIGDVFLIDDQGIANQMNEEPFMRIAKKFGCSFVAVMGLEHIKRLTDDELRNMNLRRLTKEELTVKA